MTGAPTNIVDDFAGDGNHTTKTIGFGLDGWLYVTQGSSCNVCIETDERRATMMRMRPDGTEREIYATGLRNSVGFDWAPWDGAIYATDNGRDLLGDDFPPCELNRVERGKFYGWPYVNGNNGGPPTRTSARRTRRSRASRPRARLPRHNAPLGIHFLQAAPCPPVMNAPHSSPCTARGIAAAPTATRSSRSIRGRRQRRRAGFPDRISRRGRHRARPARRRHAGPDGAIYVTDDYAGVVYRVTATPGRESKAP